MKPSPKHKARSKLKLGIAFLVLAGEVRGIADDLPQAWDEDRFYSDIEIANLRRKKFTLLKAAKVIEALG